MVKSTSDINYHYTRLVVDWKVVVDTADDMQIYHPREKVCIRVKSNECSGLGW